MGAYPVGHLISQIGTFDVSIWATIFSVVVMLAFMFISPIMARADYVSVGRLDAQHSGIDNEQLHIFLEYQLSKREIGVC